MKINLNKLIENKRLSSDSRLFQISRINLYNQMNYGREIILKLFNNGPVTLYL